MGRLTLYRRPPGKTGTDHGKNRDGPRNPGKTAAGKTGTDHEISRDILGTPPAAGLVHIAVKDFSGLLLSRQRLVQTLRQRLPLQPRSATLGLSGRLRWRVRNHPGIEKAGRDAPPLSVGRGESHTPLGKGGYVRNGSMDVQRGLPVGRDPTGGEGQQSASAVTAGSVYQWPQNADGHQRALSKEEWNRAKQTFDLRQQSRRLFGSLCGNPAKLSHTEFDYVCSGRWQSPGNHPGKRDLVARPLFALSSPISTLFPLLPNGSPNVRKC